MRQNIKCRKESKYCQDLGGIDQTFYRIFQKFSEVFVFTKIDYGLEEQRLGKEVVGEQEKAYFELVEVGKGVEEILIKLLVGGGCSGRGRTVGYGGQG